MFDVEELSDIKSFIFEVRTGTVVLVVPSGLHDSLTLMCRSAIASIHIVNVSYVFGVKIFFNKLLTTFLNVFSIQAHTVNQFIFSPIKLTSARD